MGSDLTSDLRLVLCPNCTYPFRTDRTPDDIKQCPACSYPFKIEEKVRRLAPLWSGDAPGSEVT